MNSLLITRVCLICLLMTWSFLDYGFVRGSYGIVLPNLWHMLIMLILSLLLMIPSVVFVPLWVLPQILQKWHETVRLSRNCCHTCGRQLDARSRICTECGPVDRSTSFSNKTMFINCLSIWLACWIIGSAMAETIARLDEVNFIQSQQQTETKVESRPRWKPFWGMIHWDEQNQEAYANLHTW